MLRQLVIRDFVLVHHLELEFPRGFGVLTGETGAGKSILVDALAFVLGERADSGLVRAGAPRTEVTACFDHDQLPELRAWLAENDFPVDEELMLRRVLEASGRSRAYLNGSPATGQQLRQAAEWLVDIHGQHAHQSLLRSDAQRKLLDDLGGLGELAREVAQAWRNYSDAARLLTTAEQDGARLAEERQALAWRCEELEGLGLSLEEWEALGLEHKRLAHGASLLDGARFALDLLSEGDASCEQRMDEAGDRLADLEGYDPALKEIAELVRSARVELGEAGSLLRRYLDRVELDPARLAEVELRIETVMGLARKYRVAPEALPELLLESRQRLDALEASADLDRLREKVARERAAFDRLAGELSQGRSRTAASLGQGVTEQMQALALGGGRFEVALLAGEPGAHGGEQVEFRIAGLSGREAKSLAKVASGGELSRISLAIQVVATAASQVPTLIFDEVDVGIGGGVAEVVGRLLRGLGEQRQILCVTHLPQVAACANWQWQVKKLREDEDIRSQVVPLTAEERVEEIARMLGGVEITSTTREHARELLGFKALTKSKRS